MSGEQGESQHSRRNTEERGSVIRSRSSLLSLVVVAGQCCRARGRGRPSPSASSGNVSLSVSIAFSASASARVRLCIWLARSHRPLRGVACPPRARRAEKSVPAGTPAGDPDDERRDPENNIAAAAAAAAAKRRHCDQVCATYPMLRKGSESRFRSVPSSGCDRRGKPETRTLPPRWNLVCLFASPS